VRSNEKVHEACEDTIAAINDLGEDTRRELDDIYLALSQLADKQKQEGSAISIHRLFPDKSL